MSKRYGRSRQINPNRARGKNNPGGKGNDPPADWFRYNGDRRSEDKRFVQWLRRIAEIAREILGIAPGTHDGRVSAMTVSILKGGENLSYRSRFLTGTTNLIVRVLSSGWLTLAYDSRFFDAPANPNNGDVPGYDGHGEQV